MAQPKDTLEFLTDSQGRSYRVHNGMVGDPVNTPTFLPESPDGWQEVSIKYQRSDKYFGLFRMFSTPLKFVRNGALIIRSRLYNKWIEDKLYYVMHRLDKTFGGGWIHRFLYRGELDLAQVNDEDTHVEVNIMEGDLVKMVKANESTTYEIDINVPEAITVKMDGAKLSITKRFIVINPTYPHGLNNTVKEMIPMQDIESDGNFFNASFVSEAGSISDADYSFIQGEDLSTSDKYNGLTENGITFTAVRMTGTIGKFIVGGIFGARVGFDVKIETNTGRVINVFTVQHEFANVNEKWKFDISSGPIALLPGERFFVYQVPNAFQSNNAWNYEDDVIFEYKGLDQYKTTYIKALRPAYVAQKLLDKMTGGGYSFSSIYLNTVWENLLTTSGDAIRGFDNPKLKLSWVDFFTSYNVPCNLSSGIRNNVLFIERKQAVYQSTIQQHLGDATGLSIEVSKDLLCNSLKIGYPNTDTEEVNGRDEFNVTQTYTSPLTRVTKVLELVSKIRGSMYEIELTRINLDGRTTTDDSNDNSPFFLHVEKTATIGTGTEPSTFYKLLREIYTSISGIIDPATAFNIGISPKRCLIAHGNYLRSIFYGMEGGKLIFQTSDKNSELITIKDGTTISEKGDIVIGELEAPLFIPLEFKFTSPMAANIIEVMEAGPDGTFSFTYDGATLYGFPLEVGIQPANRPAQETTLLCSPQTDLTKLITYGR